MPRLLSNPLSSLCVSLLHTLHVTVSAVTDQGLKGGAGEKVSLGLSHCWATGGGAEFATLAGGRDWGRGLGKHLGNPCPLHR